MKKVLITICGRAGSKGFKNKNLKTFLEKPLVYYTLASAFNFADTVEDAKVDVCLNTDSQDLADLVLAKSGSSLYPSPGRTGRRHSAKNGCFPAVTVLYGRKTGL